jgi:ATP-dependent Clp protease protease subunit
MSSKEEEEDIHVDLNHNILYISGEINDSTAFQVNKIINNENQKLKQLCLQNPFIDQISCKPLYLFITSSGGYFTAAMNIVDCIESSNIPIHTVVEGYAYSSATIISVAGKKRYIKKHACMLIHQLKGGVNGTYRLIKDYSSSLDKDMQVLKEFYLEKTKMTLQQLEDYLCHDKYLMPKECIELGIIDEIYDGVQL